MIRKATIADLEKVKKLFVEYQKWLNVDLCFQSFDSELASLPGSYSEPKGAILVADLDGELVGCVALRPHADRIAEIKRLYVKPEHQGKVIGHSLFSAVLQVAKDAGYSKVILDTLPIMERAKAMYVKYGLTQISPYYNNPLSGVEYYEKLISQPRRREGH